MKYVFLYCDDILIVNHLSLTQKELQHFLVLGHPKRLIQHTVRRYYLGVYVVCVCTCITVLSVAYCAEDVCGCYIAGRNKAEPRHPYHYAWEEHLRQPLKRRAGGHPRSRRQRVREPRNAGRGRGQALRPRRRCHSPPPSLAAASLAPTTFRLLTHSRKFNIN